MMTSSGLFSQMLHEDNLEPPKTYIYNCSICRLSTVMEYSGPIEVAIAWTLYDIGLEHS